MPQIQDLTGQIFNRLTVICRAENKKKKTCWHCKCSCGNSSIVSATHLKSGKILSCGCLNLEINSIRMKGNKLGYKHGFENHPLRFIRKAMLHRCYNQNNKFYKNYGGRGISVCEEWKNSLENFIQWGLTNGWIKGLSLDRKDNDGSYCPENCHWITIFENSSKKRSPELKRRKNYGRRKSSPQLQS